MSIDTVGAPRAIAHRTLRRQHGPITRLVSPSGTGEAIKPFVFLDRGEVRHTGKPLFGIHPHSCIATVTHSPKRFSLPPTRRQVSA